MQVSEKEKGHSEQKTQCSHLPKASVFLEDQVKAHGEIQLCKSHSLFCNFASLGPQRKVNIQELYVIFGESLFYDVI